RQEWRLAHTRPRFHDHQPPEAREITPSKSGRRGTACRAPLVTAVVPRHERCRGRSRLHTCSSIGSALAHITLMCLSIFCLALYVSSVVADPYAASQPPLDTALTEVELADPTMAATPEKRHQLHYLVTCALPQHIVLYTQQGAERFTFPGQMG